MSACAHVGLFTCQVGCSRDNDVCDSGVQRDDARDNDACDSGVQRDDARDSDACVTKVSCHIGDTSDGVTELSIEDKLNHVFLDMGEKLKANRAVFLPAFHDFVNSCEKCTTWLEHCTHLANLLKRPL